jgi:putative phosphoesterase
MTTIGIISDTHGLLRPEALAALAGSQYIIHAGDIGSMAVIDGLRKIAPVTAVRGNVDSGDLKRAFSGTEVLEVEKKFMYVLHALDDLDLDPLSSGFDVVVSGHSHQPKIETRNGVLFLNPGSAGPRRFKLPVTVARIEITRSSLRPRIIELPVAGRHVT